MTKRPGPAARAVLGTMTFGDTTEESEARRILEQALEHGVTDVDTANVYAGGFSEEILGRVLPQTGVNVATKVGMPSDDAPGLPPLSASAVDICVRASLKRLRRDSVDVLYLHQPDRSTPEEETLAAVRTLVDEGVVGALGVSNYASWQIERVRTAAKLQGLEVSVAQQVYSPVARRLEAEYAEYAAVTGLSTIVYNPLAGGLLTGRYSAGVRPDEGRFATSRLGEMYRGRYWSSELFAVIDELDGIAGDAGMSLIELTLRWVLAQPVVERVLLGASRAEQLVMNLESVESSPLDTEVAARVTEATNALLGAAPAYNR